ncbi:MAG TPA: 3-deoxy-7-phosphoheptulonate synthase [Candidatus Omnitrophica bacterium]|nr:MAG: 3-deoxy-7-phosphoheptulonate synthase [Omnitrophica WOR_2 bacterium GWA2_45_18]HBR15233.1 3-deoxy-7-phosphoheptulonate synthase [Candidatus Omnitrophota bacterium]
MSFQYLKKIPSIDEIMRELPLSPELKEIKQSRDAAIRDVFDRRNGKFLVIIGPCSADNEDAVCEYVGRLSALQSQVQDHLILIPRVYTNKPRTTGEGYKGMGHQPDPNEEPNVVEGIKAIRRMHIRVLKESHLSAADEMLYPGNYPLLEDLISYVAIGARSVENQQHRLTVSGLDVPAGMKNPTSGDLNVMLNSIKAAQIPHVFIYNGWEVKTSGNPLAHGILRGAVNQYGQNLPNYHYEDLMKLMELFAKRSFSHPTILVDSSHANSNKIFSEQPRIAMEVMQSLQKSETLRKSVKGLMIESYLVEGAQNVSGKTFGQSITDACLGWADSERLVLDLADAMSKLPH